jgi:hypothetical protein
MSFGLSAKKSKVQEIQLHIVQSQLPWAVGSDNLDFLLGGESLSIFFLGGDGLIFLGFGFLPLLLIFGLGFFDAKSSAAALEHTVSIIVNRATPRSDYGCEIKHLFHSACKTNIK